MFKKIAKITGLTFCIILCISLFIIMIVAGLVILNWLGNILPVDVIGASFVIICSIIMFKWSITEIINIICNW